MVATMPISSRVHNLGPVTRIPLGEGRTFEIGHTAVAVFFTREGKVLATQAFCPHQGAPLADGIIGAGKLICPLHGCKFDLATGKPEGTGCTPLDTYPVSLGGEGDILLSLGDPP